MTNEQNDGGYAFPVAGYINEHGNEIPGEFGMTLRDWFAGQALASFTKVDTAYDYTTGHCDTALARRAWAAADAMLAQREKETTDG